MVSCGALISLRCIASLLCHVKVITFTAKSNSHKMRGAHISFTMAVNIAPDELHKNKV